MSMKQLTHPELTPELKEMFSKVSTLTMARIAIDNVGMDAAKAAAVRIIDACENVVPPQELVAGCMLMVLSVIITGNQPTEENHK